LESIPRDQATLATAVNVEYGNAFQIAHISQFPMVKEDAYLWAKRRAKNLFDYVASWTDDTDHKYEKDGLWSVKKLLAIEWYIDPFFRIASKHFKKWAYVDFFSSSGLMLLTSETFQKKHTSVGSALLALFLAKSFPFKEYYFFDKERPYIDALNKRIARITDKLKDCKIHVEPLPFEESAQKLFGPTGSLNKNAMSLVVLDPEGLEVKWKPLHDILVYGKVDVILTIMTFALARNHSNALKNPSGAYARTMTEFFGDDGWKYLKSNGEELIAYYRKNIERLGYRTHRIRVERTGESVMYDMLFCTTSQTVAKIFKDLEAIMKEITPKLLAGAVGTAQKEFNDLTDYL
jgi:three-Cys-motif partner protein